MTATDVPWDERPAARFDPDDPYACPWECDPPAWDEPTAWQPGTPCPQHGSAFQRGCVSCPPDSHPLHDLPRLRRARP